MTRDELIRSLLVERYQRPPKFDPDTPERQAQRRTELARALGITNNIERPPLRVVDERTAA